MLSGSHLSVNHLSLVQTISGFKVSQTMNVVSQSESQSVRLRAISQSSSQQDVC